MCKIFVLGFTIFLSLNLGTASLYPQYLQAFHEENCVGTSTLFLDTTFNITEELPYVLHKSISLQGLWRYKQHNVENDMTTVQRSFNDVQSCESAVIGGKVVHLTSVEKLAVGDLGDSTLSLYPLRMFEGEPVVVGDEGESKIENLTVVSYVFTGPQSFTVFEGENFTGEATCLEVYGPSRSDGYGVTVRVDLEPVLFVRSAKLGCDGKKVRVIRSNMEGSRISWGSN